MFELRPVGDKLTGSKGPVKGSRGMTHGWFLGTPFCPRMYLWPCSCPRTHLVYVPEHASTISQNRPHPHPAPRIHLTFVLEPGHKLSQNPTLSVSQNLPLPSPRINLISVPEPIIIAAQNSHVLWPRFYLYHVLKSTPSLSSLLSNPKEEELFPPSFILLK